MRRLRKPDINHRALYVSQAVDDGFRLPSGDHMEKVSYVTLSVHKPPRRWERHGTVHLVGLAAWKPLCGIRPGRATVVVSATGPVSCSRCVRYAQGRAPLPTARDVELALSRALGGIR
jgi:hypothetical protein